MAVAFHLLVLAWLAFRLQWNYSVCPWNAAIAVAALTLIWPWRTTLLADWREASRPVKVMVALILFSPVLFYVALLDPFLSYCVYAENAPLAYIVKVPGEMPTASPPGATARGRDSGAAEPLLFPGARVVEISTLLPGLDVAVPPEHRLFDAYFNLTARPGETLIVEDRRLWARIMGFDHRQVTKQAESKAVP
jgi:hypothetical protein